MIADEEAAQTLMRCPEGSFLREWGRWCYQATDAPLVFHLGSGLAVLASLAAPELRLESPEAYATMWAMLVGDSGDSRKTTCVKLARNMVMAAAPERVGAHPGSPEGLRESLAEESTMLLVYPELGRFLKETSAGQYLAKLREDMTELWDCVPYEKRLKNVEVIIDDPRLSLLGGVTPAFLSDSTSFVDWEGGFLSRWVLFAGRRRRFVALPKRDRQAWAEMELHAKKLVRTPIGECAGLSMDAQRRWVTWATAMDDQYRDEGHAWARSNVARLGDVAAKVALLCSLDWGETTPQHGWMISEETLNVGLAIAEMHLHSVLWTVEQLKGSVFEQQRTATLRACQAAQRPLSMGQILARVTPRMRKRDVKEVLDTLKLEGKLHEAQIGTTLFYTCGQERTTGNVIPLAMPVDETDDVASPEELEAANVD